MPSNRLPAPRNNNNALTITNIRGARSRAGGRCVDLGRGRSTGNPPVHEVSGSDLGAPLTVDDPAVVVEVVKLAEDRSGDVSPPWHVEYTLGTGLSTDSACIQRAMLIAEYG
ncbi:hypothetical protein [Phytoactinopolyspora mesophila]|uniref:Uncharacterized protein n=1 Tax=Phytoactinopolyspora mesophila TaxID=2650750 RepID=A0A7K3M0P5_9ACTN|nr:hypothetical protein [Phytoactinopolyspora mesophila]NDL56462.1 hypothetical protein [Phytoactinopolyspora mesophila]